MSKPIEIELHVGHYGDGTGAKKLVDEVQYARKFIKRIYDILIANKVPATYYEDKVSKNQTQNINNLISHHNKDTNGFIVSGHLNASAGIVDKSIGAEVLYYDQLGVAQKVVNTICKASGMTNRGAKKRTDLGVLVRTYEPAILIEFGFVNSKKDVELMDKHFEAICQAVAKELASVIGCTINNDSSNKEELSVSAEQKLQKQIDELKKLVSGKADSTSTEPVSVWAKEAVDWAVKEGIITGDGNSLNAGGALTREQLSVMLKRFHDKFVK